MSSVPKLWARLDPIADALVETLKAETRGPQEAVHVLVLAALKCVRLHNRQNEDGVSVIEETAKEMEHFAGLMRSKLKAFEEEDRAAG